VQRRFTKRLSGFSKLSCDERLAGLIVKASIADVLSDLVMCYQMLTGSVNIDTDAFYTLSYLSTTRGNSMNFSNPNLHQYMYGMVTFSLTALLAIGIRFRIVSSHHHLLLASSENRLLIFTCKFSS